MSAPIPTLTTITPTPPPSSNRPLRTIPGSYGLPVLGPIGDRLNYSWFQGQDTFFRKKMDTYKSSVFRTNIPPCFPFYMGVNPNIIALLDVPSFSHLFDMDIIDKKNVLVGDFMPSTKFTGDRRVGVYLDTTEELHTKVKNFALDVMKRSSTVWVSSLLTNLDIMWTTIEQSLSKNGTINLSTPLEKCLFNFLSQGMLRANPANYSPELSETGHSTINKWLAVQLLPVLITGLFQPLEEIFLHCFSYPFFLVKGDYQTLVSFVAKEAREVIERGKSEFGLSEEDIIHNLLFNFGFNAFGGFKVFLPALVNNLRLNNDAIQEVLRKEVRGKCRAPSSLSFSAIQDMPNVQSFVYETLRLNPPIPLQYGRARKDFVLQSHDSRFHVKKGELLCGYQTLVMRDPKVFDDPETFVPDRFMGEKGAELLNYLFWSNGPQNAEADASNKQCAGKDYVPLTACLFLADLFLRYDSITLDLSGTITGVEKAKSKS